jgi:two-component system response regulator (stage 0 sporulation protein A)
VVADTTNETNEISVMLVDDSKIFCDSLQQFLDLQEDMHVCSVAYNGEMAMERLKTVHPDVIILDIAMPVMDGLGVLEELNLQPPSERPDVIMLSGLVQDESMRRAIELGAKYFMLKPIDFQVLANRIRDIKRSLSRAAATLAPMTRNLDIEVTRVLQQMCVPPHVKGYPYIRDAIILVIEEPNLIGAVTKELYPLIAEKHDTTASRVERAIRNAIKLTWERGNPEVLNNFFAYTDTRRGRPTNSEFIALVADRLRIGERVI